MNRSGFPNSFRRPLEGSAMSQQLQEAEQRQLLQLQHHSNHQAALLGHRMELAREQALLRDVVASQALSSLQQQSSATHRPAGLLDPSWLPPSSSSSGLFLQNNNNNSGSSNTSSTSARVVLEEARKVQELRQLQSLLDAATAAAPPVQASSEQELLLRQLQGRQQLMLPAHSSPQAMLLDRFHHQQAKRRLSDDNDDDVKTMPLKKQRRISVKGNSFPLPSLQESKRKSTPLQLFSYQRLWGKLEKCPFREEVFKRRLQRANVPLTGRTHSVVEQKRRNFISI